MASSLAAENRDNVLTFTAGTSSGRGMELKLSTGVFGTTVMPLRLQEALADRICIWKLRERHPSF